jgi:hypothetical protein
MSRVWELRRGGGARKTAEYVGLLDSWLDSESATVIQGQVVALGVRGGIIDGVGVWRRPYRRPESVVPAAMVEPHRVIRWSLPHVEIRFFCRFFEQWETTTMADPP